MMRLRNLFVCILNLLFIGAANAHCFDQAGQEYGIHPMLLKAIAKHESRLVSDVISPNNNGSFDVGLMQINTVHLVEGEPLQRHGFSIEDLLKPCLNIKVGAWLLSRQIQRVGNTWEAVAAYHSRTKHIGETYAVKVQAVFKEISK